MPMNKNLTYFLVVCGLVLIVLLLYLYMSTNESGSIVGTSIMEVSKFPPDQRETVRKSVEQLRLDSEDPAEFYAEIETRSDGIVIVHLWHESAFSPENRGVVGNPGGKCRDLYYDPKENRITQKLFWQ